MSIIWKYACMLVMPYYLQIVLFNQLIQRLPMTRPAIHVYDMVCIYIIGASVIGASVSEPHTSEFYCDFSHIYIFSVVRRSVYI